jgi:hypothetical protein
MIALLAYLAMASAEPERGTPTPVTEAELARRLDLTSFPNSTGPRRRAGAVTPADYGFTRLSMRDGWTVLSEADGGWDIGLRRLSSDRGEVLVCFLDQARNGGSYRTQTPLELTRGTDGLFRASRELSSIKDCPSVP